MTLHVTPAEAEQLTVAGSGVLFRQGGIATSSLDDKATWTDIPPAEFVEAAKPCETCPCPACGRGAHDFDPDVWHGCTYCKDEPCPDCLDGKRRVAVVGPCVYYPDNCPEVCCAAGCDHGLVTVAHVVVTWGPLVVVEVRHDDEWPAASVCLDPENSLWRTDSVGHAVEFLDGPFSQSLVGQWAIGVEVVS